MLPSEVKKLVDRLGPKLGCSDWSVSVMSLLAKSTNQLATDSKSLLALCDLNMTSQISSELSKSLLKGFGARLRFVGGSKGGGSTAAAQEWKIFLCRFFV
jgi:hypothetical protein